MAKQQSYIPKSAFKFLETLTQNNNRDWFNAHKEEFLEERAYIENFADLLLAELNSHDLIETPSGKKSLYRIYRDTRFSPDKTPYKNWWSGSFKRATKQRRGGYYFHIESGNNFVVGGFRNPDTGDLRRIREEISFDPIPLRKILNADSFIATFGTLQGEQLKTTPQGFGADDEAIDLLRYKQFLLIRKFTDEEVLSPSFLDETNLTFKNMRPFFDYMSNILSTDANGNIIL
jgi:uncharacterized protein (TIGR02453 family)